MNNLESLLRAQCEFLAEAENFAVRKRREQLFSPCAKLAFAAVRERGHSAMYVKSGWNYSENRPV